MAIDPIGARLFTLRVTETIGAAEGTDDARSKLEDLVETQFRSGVAEAPIADGPAPVPAEIAAVADEKVSLLERRLQQAIRALRREHAGRGSEAALRVLGHDAIRLLIEIAGWRRLVALNATTASGPALIQREQHRRTADAQKLFQLLTDAKDHRGIASIAFSQATTTTSPTTSTPTILTSEQRAALVDILQSADPQYGTNVREGLAFGDGFDKVRGMLFERLPPATVSTTSATTTANKTTGDAANGLTFDFAINKWVAKDRSWAYQITLEQIFDYIVDAFDKKKARIPGGIIVGHEELKARLLAAANDPATGAETMSADAIASFIDDLRAARASGNPRVAALLGASFDMCFSTTDGGDTPVAAFWQLPLRLTADLFAAMSDTDFRAELTTLAAAARTEEQTRRQALLAPLASLLEKYNGVPRRHKRAHGALINLGLAGQSVSAMAKDDGILPRQKTLLDPETLKQRYAEAEHKKMRFLFTDEFEMFVIGDDMFQEVVDKHHFPPNHELLSYNHAIAGSGYVTVDHGRIVGLEDDIEMLKGKLPDNLPPALEVLRARGFPLDEEKIRESSLVIDWESFTKLAKETAALQPAGDPREALVKCAHGDRPALIVGLLKARLESERTATGDEKLAQARATELATELLKGFRIINVAARDFRKGDLPAELNEFCDLMVDATLAPYLVRKVAS